MRIKQPIVLPDSVREIAKLFHAADHKLFVVGGAVRDAILLKNPKDFDLATDAVPDRVLSILNGHFSTLEIGKAFGVVSAVTQDFPKGIEIATFRADVGKGRRPDSVIFSDIETDVKRRDLTINALFYDIKTEEIVDLVGGLSDLKNRIVRTVGSPTERFDEDPLRKLRAIRFAVKMGFDLDSKLRDSLIENNSLDGVSPERIRDEFLKTMLSDEKNQALQLFEFFGFFPMIFPGLKVNSSESSFSKNVPVLLARMLSENERPVLGKILNKLTWSEKEIREMDFLLSLRGFSPESVFDFWKKRKAIQIDDETVKEFWKSSFTEAFLKFECTTSGQSLMDAGFVGAGIATEMKRLEAANFLATI